MPILTKETFLVDSLYARVRVRVEEWEINKIKYIKNGFVVKYFL